jgi:hypothetical protein
MMRADRWSCDVARACKSGASPSSVVDHVIASDRKLMSMLDLLQWPAMVVTVVRGMAGRIAGQAPPRMGILGVPRQQCAVDRVGWHDHAYALIALQLVLAADEYPGRAEERPGSSIEGPDRRREQGVDRFAMTLPVPLDYPPMEAKLVAELPDGPEWQYEPKWDGFRCLAFRNRGDVHLQSKSGQPLARYFPELVADLRALAPQKFVLDGEIVVPHGESLSFDLLLQRIHPAASRIARLSSETPALFVVFDLLVDGAWTRPASSSRLPGGGPRSRSSSRRFRRVAASSCACPRSRTTAPMPPAGFDRSGPASTAPSPSVAICPISPVFGTGMQKYKLLRTADCVVGGFRYASKGKLVGSLLLGLYDDDGLLNHVGFSASLRAADRAAITRDLERLIEPPGFTGNAPGGPSRWSTERSGEWQPLAPRLVAEVRYDHFSDGRFRHGTKFLRWRPDKAPRQCTMKQVEQESASVLRLLGTQSASSTRTRVAAESGGGAGRPGAGILRS